MTHRDILIACLIVILAAIVIGSTGSWLGLLVLLLILLVLF
jgi:hypothetical protein